MTEPTTPHRIVIVGGGVAGIDLASALAGRKGLAVTLVDVATRHVWKPMLHSIAAGTRDAARVGVSYLRQARRYGFDYAPGLATAIDPEAGIVSLAPVERDGREVLPPRDLPYDTLVIASGSVAETFDVPGVVEHARHIDSLAQASDFQEAAAACIAAAAAAGGLARIAIVGGGATGVQLAAELVRIADTYDQLGLDGAQSALRITLLDRAPRLLTAFPERVSAAARAKLEGLGVEVRPGVDVVAATADGLSLEGDEPVAADIVVWAAGIRASPLTARIAGVERGRSERIVVDARCRTAIPNIFALGDCAEMVPAGDDAPLPPTAQVAYQQAIYLGRHLPALIAGRGAPDFRYHDRGALVALGGYGAYGALGDLGVFGKRFIKGQVAQAGHALLYRRHQARLHGVGGMLRLWLAERLERGVAGQAPL